jgi:sialic acid synthase SpsE
MVAGRHGDYVKMKTIRISNKLIGDDHPIFIIAEAGVNHNGKLEIAKKLIDAAVYADADAVKFQVFKSENVTTKDADSTSYVKHNLGGDVKQLDILKRYELSYNDFKILKK